MKRLLIVALGVLLALSGTVAPVEAGAEWCDTDPLVLVQTPDGAIVPVFLLVGTRGPEHLPAALAASLLATSHTVEETRGGRATRVTLKVTVPDDLFERGFPTRATVSSGPLGSGKVHAKAEGKSGTTMILRFTIPVP